MAAVGMIGRSPSMSTSKAEMQDFQVEWMWQVKEGVKDDFTKASSFSVRTAPVTFNF